MSRAGTSPRSSRPFDGSTVRGVAVVATLFVLVFAVRSAFYNPNDGLGLFFCIPVAVAAVRFGPVVGALCGVIATALFIVWARHATGGSIILVGYISRFTVFVTIGTFVGYFARARQQLDVRSRRLFDLSPDLMGTVDATGRLVSCNDAWSRAAPELGSAAPLDARALMELLDDRGDEPFEQTILHAGAGAGAGAAPGAGDAPHAQASRVIEWRARRDPAGGLRYVVGRDVTDRVERAAHVEQLLAAVQGARDAERARVAGDLHDFVLQQLLVAMMHLETSADPSAPTVDQLVRDSVGALRGIIDGIQPLDLDHVSTGDALERCALTTERTYGIRVRREIELAAELPDARKLLAYRMTCEALRNAAKHAGVVEVELRATQDASGFVRVTVHDEGRGLPAPMRAGDRVSSAFGTGFVLLAEQVLAVGGRVDVTSAPGVGTTVEVELPNAPSADRQAPEPG